jgi:competence protein ComEC
LKRLLLPSVVVVSLLAGTVWAGNLTVSFLDVGQGDAILIRSPEGKVALVDAGPSRDVLGILKDEGVDKIDVAISSHHHADHIGGMADVIKKYEPKVYVDSGSSQTSAVYRKVLSAVDQAGCQLVQPKKDSERKIELGSVVLRLFPQPPEDEGNENNNSVGIRVEYQEFSLLLTGDSQESEQSWWLKNVDDGLYRHVAVMKAPHHGSRNGMNLAWLKATKPEFVVISCGRENSYGHPHEATVRLLTRLNVSGKRTDVDGTITIETDGTTWKVKDPEDEDDRTSLIWRYPRVFAA